MVQKSVNEQKPVNDKTFSGGARPITLNSTEEELKVVGIPPNFIESWIKSFKIDYENRAEMYCE